MTGLFWLSRKGAEVSAAVPFLSRGKKKQTLLRYYYINGLLRGFESERNRLKGRLPFPTYFSVSARA